MSHYLFVSLIYFALFDHILVTPDHMGDVESGLYHNYTKIKQERIITSRPVSVTL